MNPMLLGLSAPLAALVWFAAIIVFTAALVGWIGWCAERRYREPWGLLIAMAPVLIFVYLSLWFAMAHA